MFKVRNKNISLKRWIPFLSNFAHVTAHWVLKMYKYFQSPSVIKTLNVCFNRVNHFDKYEALLQCIYGISRRKCSIEKDVLKNFSKFIWKHLCRRFFFNEVNLGLRPATLLKWRLRYWIFFVNFAKFVKTSFFKNTSWWLLLHLLMTLNIY